MIARCVHNHGSELPETVHGRFYTDKTVFHLDVDSEYRVFAMSLWETALIVLVCDETGQPNWLPIGLFKFNDYSMPSDWEFVLLDGGAASGGNSLSRETARWGYQEMIRNPKHHDALIEREQEALKVFFDEVARQSDEDG
jgi:hypothetical protein